ncbi:hypothetical protein A4G99_12545 [Haladaptatus sp. R4]|uniref:hypothetical protein n=1 Tax=Haladaptatus sp. R4 TaxID=1679489 RepID=UPI0007B4EA1B|nr:hypothetical protein [Haladaptatus sp. R4]KZN23698.1 hypothetical protein A4G99_12545 [Haladaptatus sp. R4]
MDDCVKRLLRWFSSDKDYGEEINIVEVEYQNNLEHFLAKALKDRLYSWYSVVYGVLIIFIVIDFLNHSSRFLQTYGLVYDVVGATILARGLFRGEQEIIFDIQEKNLGPKAEIAEQRYDSMSITVEMLNTADGIFGVIFLVTGFIFQIVSSLPNSLFKEIAHYIISAI